MFTSNTFLGWLYSAVVWLPSSNLDVSIEFGSEFGSLVGSTCVPFIVWIYFLKAKSICVILLFFTFKVIIPFVISTITFSVDLEPSPLVIVTFETSFPESSSSVTVTSLTWYFPSTSSLFTVTLIVLSNFSYPFGAVSSTIVYSSGVVIFVISTFCAIESFPSLVVLLSELFILNVASPFLITFPEESTFSRFKL